MGEVTEICKRRRRLCYRNRVSHGVFDRERDSLSVLTFASAKVEVQM